MRVSIDGSRCQAYGICAMTAPEVFEVDVAAGRARVRDPEPDHELHPHVLEAEGACPVAAVVVEAGPGAERA